MAFGTMTSRVLGQVRESLLAYYFDKRITDAYAAAFKLPNLFRRVLGEGSLSVSFIPVFVDAKLDSQFKAQNLVNSVYTFLLLILGCLTTIGVLFPEVFLKIILDPQYVADVEKFALTVRMAKIMFGFLFFISSYAFMMGILNALGQFSLPAMAPTFFNIAMIAFTIAPQSWFAVVGDQLALGVIVGGFFQMFVLFPALMKSGYFPRLSFQFSQADFKRVLKSMGPGVLGLGLLQLTTVINLRFASSLVEGTISYISYVDRLIELPLSLISVSLGTALLPALSQLKAQNQIEKFGQTTRHYLEMNLLVTMAAAAGLYTLAYPVVQLLFGRGKFGPTEVAMTAEILKTYCWIMVFSSGVRVLTPAYYAVKNTWVPALVSGFCLITHLLAAPYLMARYQVNGLMISTIGSATLNLILLLFCYQKIVGDFAYRDFLKNLIMYTGLAFVTGAAAQVYFLLDQALPQNILFLILNTTLSIVVSIIVFITIGYALNLNVVREIVQKVNRKLKAKLRA